MRSTLPTALRLSTGHEGGYSNHPKDRGGPTNHGITQATLSAFIGRRASISDVKGLSKDSAALIYEKQYWKTINGDELPVGIDYAVFDFAINSGPARAAKELQKLVGVPADGIVGRKTILAINSRDQESLIRDYNNARLKFCKSLSSDQWRTFGRGWTIRITGKDPKGKLPDKLGVTGEALRIYYADRHRIPTNVIPTPPAQNTGKARDSDIKTLAPKRNKIQLGTIGTALFAACTPLLEQITPYKETFKVAFYLFIGVSVVLAVAVLLMNISKIREAGQEA